MPLPNPGMSFTPFDPLPASDLNDMVENIEALQDWSAFTANTLPASLLTDDSIGGGKLNFAATGADGIWWEELGRTVLGANGSTITVNSLPARRYLKIVTDTTGVAGSATGELLRFNNDSGNNYDHRRSIANDASSLTTATSSIDMYGDVAAQSFGEYYVRNLAANNKPVMGKRMVAYPNGGSGVTWVDIAAVWRNASAAISRVDYLSTGALFATGSSVIVLGHN